MNVVKCQDILGFGQPVKKTFWVDFKVKIYTQDPAIGVYEGHHLAYSDFSIILTFFYSMNLF